MGMLNVFSLGNNIKGSGTTSLRNDIKTGVVKEQDYAGIIDALYALKRWTKIAHIQTHIPERWRRTDAYTFNSLLTIMERFPMDVFDFTSSAVGNERFDFVRLHQTVCSWINITSCYVFGWRPILNT